MTSSESQPQPDAAKLPGLFGGPASVGRPPRSPRDDGSPEMLRLGDDECESDMGSVSRLLPRLAGGDDAAQTEIWRRYSEQLIRLAHGRLLGSSTRVRNEEDVAVEVLHSFFRGVQAGRFPRLKTRRNLWKILVTLTVRRVIDHIQSEARIKRGGGRVAGESAIAQFADSSSSARGGIQQIPCPDPTPDIVVEVAEQAEALLAALNSSELSEIAQLKAAGCSNEEIADKLRRSLRTVERRIAEIREIWRRHDEAS